MAELETQSMPGTLTASAPTPGFGPGAPTVLDDDTPAIHPPTDPVLFESEMNPHLDALYRNALRLTGNPNDAEDLLQDTYLRAYRFFYQYQPGTNAKAWLFRIMNTVFLNDYRRKSRQGETVSYDGLEDFYLYNRLTEDGVSGLGGDHPETENPEKAVLEKLDIETITRAIQALPPEFRETVALATLEELSYQEIADTLEIPVGTVRSRLSRGRNCCSAPSGSISMETRLVDEPKDEPEVDKPTVEAKVKKSREECVNADFYSCEEAVKRLNEYLDHQLTDIERVVVLKHLEICRPCLRRFTFEQTLIISLRQKVSHLCVPLTLREKLHMLLRDKPS